MYNEVALGRSNLLPTISANLSTDRNNADIIYRQGTIGQVEHPRYLSRSAVVQMRQPILNLDGLVRYQQGKVQADQGKKAYDASTSDLTIRVISAYLDVLFAEDQVSLSQVQRDTLAEQVNVNKSMFELGEGTRTDMLETQARLDLSTAQVAEAKDNLEASRQILYGITGIDPGTLVKLGHNFSVVRLSPSSFVEWQTLAIKYNPEIQAAQLAIESTSLDIRRNKVAHMPRFDLVAIYSKGDAETLNSYNQNTINRSIGVQLNIPIYAGGAVRAATRQAVAANEKARAELQARVDRISVELRKAFSQAASSIDKIKALEEAVQASRLLMVATKQSIKAGVRINLDLLSAQQQLYSAQRDLSQARYTYILAIVRLHAAAGTINPSRVREISAYFE